jgi:hypothetical protein
MATIAEVSRGLNAVHTVGQAKIAIGEALSQLSRGYSLPRTTAQNRQVLDRVRVPLEQWYSEIKSLPDAMDYKAEFARRRDLIIRAYVEIEGIVGEITARSTVSFWKEVGVGIQELPADIGRGIGTVARGVGETAGSVVGGLFAGLGPVVVVVIGLAIYFALRGKK